MNHVQCSHRSLAMGARRAIAAAIVCLIVAGSTALGHSARDAFAAPSYWLLAILSCALVIPHKANAVTTLQKALAAYLAALSVDHLSGVYWPLAWNFQIATGLPIAAATVLAAWVAADRKAGGAGSGELAVATGLGAGIIAAALLATGLLVHGWYGFGSEQSCGVGGQLAMSLLVGIAAWRLAGDAAVRIAIGATGIAVYTWMAVSF
jgi:hypothetical protein